ncbi:MAG: hypothetical protein ACLGHT_11865, partial [Acidimicrobiia bacterium]
AAIASLRSAAARRGPMPKVNPETGEPMSDDPDQQEDELRGGKVKEDPALDDAKETGGGPLNP